MDQNARPTVGLKISEPYSSTMSRFLLCAGERSGDLYAGKLIETIRDLDETIEIEGIGGERFRRAGGKTLYDIADFADVGFIGPLKKLAFYARVIRALKKRIDEDIYDGVILIDFPDFNMRIAKIADEAGLPVFYHCAPQFWAWRRWRVKRARAWVDMMSVAFPFEEKFYTDHGIDARFHGHPLLDVAPEPALNATKEEARAKLQLKSDPTKTLIALFPGSRAEEVEYILPPLLESIELIDRTIPVDCAVALAPNLARGQLEKIIATSPVKPEIVEGDSWTLMRSADMAIVKSGTTTVEATIVGLPMVIVYKLNLISYLIARALARVKFVGAPNILADEEIAPEILQSEMTSSNIAARCVELLTDKNRLNAMKNKLSAVRATLGEAGMTRKSAVAILDFMSRLKRADIE